MILHISKALYAYAKCNRHEPDRYNNIASDIEIKVILSIILFVADYLIWLAGAPQLIVKFVEWHSLTQQN